MIRRNIKLSKNQQNTIVRFAKVQHMRKNVACSTMESIGYIMQSFYDSDTISATWYSVV